MGHKPSRKAVEPEKPARKREVPQPEKPARKRKVPQPEKPARKRKVPQPEKPARKRKAESVADLKGSLDALGKVIASVEKRKRKAEKPVSKRVPKEHRSYEPDSDLLPPEFQKWPGERMRSILEIARASLPKELLKSTSFRHHEYPSGEIDGQIKLRLPRGVSAEDALQMIQDALPEDELRGLWISSGVQYTIREDEMVYRKTRGMNEVATSWQSATRSNVPEVVLIARHTISRGLSRKFHRKAESVFIRLRYAESHPKKGT